MKAYEKLGAFYLGRVENENGARPDLLLDAKDLTTHGVCVGMTGSGKTGLCLSLIEEAAIDGIPVIAIDPKGDLGNLLLSFPELRPGDFAPWIDPEEAARKGLPLHEYPVKVAELWQKGLAAWDQDGDRIRRMRETADFCIYTPGSTAGRPLTVLRGFSAPPPSLRDDPELLGERVENAVSGLLSLLGIDADPLQSREHILLAQILKQAWGGGEDLDLPALLHAIQKPPFEKVGFFDLETFFPSKDRLALAMRLNNLLASPGFAPWLQGEPLDIPSLLYTPQGKARVSILSIAHLNDSERMFFVSLLLNELISWMRTQPGTSSLRALLYMDEIFGFFPPSANPPSKKPMLTLLKQARAYGVGCLLATQNPVDLDYKGLSNTGIWMIGRLQTERDKARVMDGLEGAAAGAAFKRAEMDRILSGLGNRRFLLHNVHRGEPLLFETRWALSYLRGPLTREQIRSLTPAAPAPAPAPAPIPAPIPAPSPAPAFAAPAFPQPPPGIQIARWNHPANGAPLLPGIGGIAKLHYVRASAQLDLWVDFPFWVPLRDTVPTLDWSEMLEASAFAPAPGPSENFAPLPAPALNLKSDTALEREAKQALFAQRPHTLLRCDFLKVQSAPGETSSAFQGRLHHLAREQRDEAIAALRKKYETRFDTLQDRIRRATDRVQRLESTHKERKLNTVLNAGGALLTAFLGQKKLSVGNVSRTRTTLRSAGRLGRGKEEIAAAGEELKSQQTRLQEMEDELTRELDTLRDRFSEDKLAVTELSVPLRKTDLTLTFFGLVWKG